MQAILAAAPNVHVVTSVDEIFQIVCEQLQNGVGEVAYDLADGRRIVEASVVQVTNGIAVNFPEPYMRRREPNCMVIADKGPSDKPRYAERFGTPFDGLRAETHAWLGQQSLLVIPFFAGNQPSNMGAPVVAIIPRNAAFFAFGLVLLQGVLSAEEIAAEFKPQGGIYVAPVFRHTHFEGKQVVVHDRQDEFHEMYAYNLYPGPSAKKGVYGMLLRMGRRSGFVVPHCSTGEVTTPYDNTLVMNHSGPSGAGKSEHLLEFVRNEDGSVDIATHSVSGRVITLDTFTTCRIRPLCDDMAVCPVDTNSWYDAENGWFLRLDTVLDYGTVPSLEKLIIHPPGPLMFLSINAQPGATALPWDHTEDSPGKRCPNPRVIIPRDWMPNVVDGPARVAIRSLGIRTPFCTKEMPSYGIVGMMHELPPGVFWIWQLVSPRGHQNPSVLDESGDNTEGVGSYFPFACGTQVSHANLLLNCIRQGRGIQYYLLPNQCIGVWKVGFWPQWIAREILARRGNKRLPRRLIQPARFSTLLGNTFTGLKLEGRSIPDDLLNVDQQPDVGAEAYDAGAERLYEMFVRFLKPYLTSDGEPIQELDPLGQELIRCFLRRGTVEDFAKILPYQVEETA